MGFRFKRFDYVGGVEPWTGGDDRQLQRGNTVLKDFGDFIISCGKGWSLDTSRNASTSDFVQVPLSTFNGSATVFKNSALFFVNTNGAKLFLMASGSSTYCGIALSNDYLMKDVGTYAGTHLIYTGIIMSMIPAGSSSVFGSSFDSSFLPSDATYVVGTALKTGSSDAAYRQSFICENTSGRNYSYGLFVDECCIGIGGGYSTTATPTIKPGYFVGRVLGTLANEETTLQAKYGIIKFNDSCNDGVGGAEFKYAVCSRYTNSFNYNYGSSFSAAINTSDTPSNLAASCCGSFVKADGTRVDGRNGANVRFYPHAADFLAENTNLSNSSLSGANRWVPFEAGVVSSDLSTNGIVTGDGFKGYLDTNLFRCANVNLNQLYNNGTFIGADSTNHLMIGWDPENTDSL